ncbi:hypothetical protein GCM10011380_22720 [Sphingomonas metalli]|uniref:Hda lid domain-containing protein n=1 Tax=Sphingomonas metalli TaxID=1779358 RepID=A0A916T5S1_9SPHN|nr:DnaA/Hda family protein [Sphingomonas metalli]GGB32750.1 hypothetical protein GCM10011380_22720 [Sphingomonas metalli]
MNQMALPLGWPTDPRDEAFLLTASNEAAVRTLEGWRDWPVRSALLTGPARSGRSLLAGLFARQSGARVIDDAATVPEVELFHAWNRAQEDAQPLLIVADALPPAWPVSLPDLRTRLAASPHAAIGAPDDALSRALIARHLERRGLPAPPDLVEWLVARVERTHARIEAIAIALDRLSWERRRRLTIPLARTLLIEAGFLTGLPEDA